MSTVDLVAPGRGRRRELHLLVVRRGNPPFEGQWALPGGYLEVDEDLATARRARAPRGDLDRAEARAAAPTRGVRRSRPRPAQPHDQRCVAWRSRTVQSTPRAARTPTDAQWTPVASLRSGRRASPSTDETIIRDALSGAAGRRIGASVWADAPLGDVVALLDGWYPPATAPTTGTPSGWCSATRRTPYTESCWPSTRSQAVADEAVDWRRRPAASCHHPLFLKRGARRRGHHPKGRVVHTLLTGRLRAAHRTHQRRLPARRRLARRWRSRSACDRRRPLRAGRHRALDKLVVFAPADARRPRCARRSPRPAPARSATTTRASFTHRRARAGSVPRRRRDPRSARSASSRRSTRCASRPCCPRRPGVPAVVDAMLAAHPYEEPAYDVSSSPAAPTTRPGARAGSAGWRSR